MYYLFRTIFIFLRIMDAALFIYVILSWIMPRSRLYYMLGRFVEPFLRPFRVLSNRLLGRFALPIDFSVLFAFFGIELIQYFLTRLYYVLI